MSKITGTLCIDFDCGKDISQEQFNKFESLLNKRVSDWEIEIDDIAKKCGFEADDMYPIILDQIELDND